MADGDRDSLVTEFCSLTGASPKKATFYLEANDWKLPAASSSFFQDEEDEDMGAEAAGPSSAPPPPDYTGPRTLDGRPAPQAASQPSRSAASQPKRKGVATLGSLGSSSSNPQHDDDDEDEDEDDDNDGRGNLFAGGEKSGLAVQDPNQEGRPKKIISDILAKAKANARRPDTEAEASSSKPPANKFRGTGMTLGGDGVESRSIPDPRGPAETRRSGTPIERVLHLWQDGFSIDEGELRRFDDPANQRDLEMIRAGRAPLHLMDVQYDQAVDVKLEKHDTPYKPLPKKYRPFGGEGQRLGAVIPGASAETGDPYTTTSMVDAAARAAGSAAVAPSSPIPDFDPAQPVVSIRLQLPNGTRLPARFNTTSTLGDVYDFIARASPETQSRPWVLATTFPSKEHTDKNLVIGEMAEFKKGGTAVVKWK